MNQIEGKLTILLSFVFEAPYFTNNFKNISKIARTYCRRFHVDSCYCPQNRIHQNNKSTIWFWPGKICTLIELYCVLYCIGLLIDNEEDINSSNDDVEYRNFFKA